MLEKLRKQIAKAIMPKTTIRNLSSFNYPGQPVYSELTIKKATREGYKLSLYVYRAVRTIVQAGSGIPWVALKNGKQIPNHPFELLMKRPNPEMSGQDMMEFLIAHLKLTGNALWQPMIVAGKPKEIYIAMPDLVSPIPSTVPGEWLSGYEVTEADGKKSILAPDTFIHFMQFDPGNPYWGVGDLLAAARTVDTDNEAQDTQKVSMQSRGVPSGVFQYTENLSQGQFEEQNRRVEEIYLQKSKRRAPWVLGAGATWQQMSLSPVEMDFIASRLENKRDIAAAFGISPIFLGDLEQSSYDNMVQARKALYEDCVIPLLDDIKSTLNLKLAPLFDIEIDYDVSNVAALRADQDKISQIAQRYWSMGMPMNQINDMLELGLLEYDGWDVGYLPFSVAPVGQEPAPAPVKHKFTEEQKSTYWKRIDTRRQGYWQIISKKALALYKEEGRAVADAIGAKSEKFSLDELERITEENINKFKAKWETLLNAVELALIEDFGKQTAQDLGFVFNPASAAIKDWVKAHAAENVRSILDTNIQDVRRVILKGVEDNLSRAEIGRNLRQFYEDGSASKAMRVARTETASAAGFGQHSAAEQGNAKTHTWITSRDDRVRELHSDIDGEEQPLDEAYSNDLMYPGDPSGDAEEVINCRCVEQFS
jgi:HK97 family phage portal protein